MAKNKLASQKRPGEKDHGKFHYNPGNMSGKTADICKDESEQQANRDRIQSRHEKEDRRRR